MCSIISSSIVYGTTWTTVKIQLQNMTTCHAINNVGCTHILGCPLRLLPYEKLRTFSRLQRSQISFPHSTVTMHLTFLRSGTCQFWMEAVLSKSLHVMWKCWGRKSPSTLDPLQLWCLNSLCPNGNRWPTYFGGSWFHKVCSPSINGQTTPSFSCSIKILWVWCWGLKREGCSRVNLCQRGIIA
jgi:hypothetical protein